MPSRSDRETTSRPERDGDIVAAGAGAVCGAGVGLTALLAVARGEAAGMRVDDGAMKVEQFVPARRLRRLGRSARMMLVAAREALDGIEDRAEVGLICGTGVGALEETTEFLGQLRRERVSGASPSLFPNSVMSAIAGYVSLELGLRGYGATVTQDALSGELAVTAAADALRLGRAPMILAGGVDERSEAMRAVWRRANGSAKLGEGAAVLLLRCCGSHDSSSRRSLARVSGYATAGQHDGGASASLAARRALEMAGVGRDEIAMVIGRAEATGALGEEHASSIDISPRVGCWGAMGALNVALGVAMVADGAPNVLVCGQTSAVPASGSGEPTSLSTAIVLSNSGRQDVAGA
jgi:3-oxoacyl-[acyl-carrier-protein] synthase III